MALQWGDFSQALAGLNGYTPPQQFQTAAPAAPRWGGQGNGWRPIQEGDAIAYNQYPQIAYAQYVGDYTPANSVRRQYAQQQYAQTLADYYRWSETNNGTFTDFLTEQRAMQMNQNFDQSPAWQRGERGAGQLPRIAW